MSTFNPAALRRYLPLDGARLEAIVLAFYCRLDRAPTYGESMHATIQLGRALGCDMLVMRDCFRLLKVRWGANWTPSMRML